MTFEFDTFHWIALNIGGGSRRISPWYPMSFFIFSCKWSEKKKFETEEFTQVSGKYHNYSDQPIECDALRRY